MKEELPTESVHSDWSAFTSKSVRPIVRAVACACGAKIGMPCFNRRSFAFDSTDLPEKYGGRKNKRRSVYQNYVHASRRRAYSMLKTTTTLKKTAARKKP